MFKENLIVASLSLAISLLSFQSDVFASVDKDAVKVVNWDMSDYRTVGDSKKVLAKSAANRSSKSSYKVGDGDNIQVILYNNGVSKDDIKNLIYNSVDSKKLAKLSVGQDLDLYKIGENLDKMVIHNDEFSSIVAMKKGSRYIISDVQTPFVIDEKHISTKITTNLSSALVDNGVNSSQVSRIRNVFKGTVNLNKLRSGDSFNLVIEEKIINNGKILGYGDIVAVEIITAGVKHSAYLHKNGKEKSYYDATGKSLDAAFLRHPLKNVRITSNFNMKRMHPILKRVAPHRGSDYGAKTGTPIMATADGIVKTVGTQGGYGKVVVLQHAGGYKTLYAHMSRQNAKRGSKVKKGDVIGYVGKTGYATGPHLHYELIHNGKHIDSLRAKIPEGKSLAGEQLAKFKGDVYSIAMKFEKVKVTGGDYIIASNKKSNDKGKYFD